MGGKLSKKGLNMAYEKPIAQKVEEPTQAATVKPEENEGTSPGVESTEKRDQDSHVSADETDQEGGRVPAVHPEEACKPESRQLDVVPNEEQLVAIANEETTKSPEADPAQLLEVSAPKELPLVTITDPAQISSVRLKCLQKKKQTIYSSEKMGGKLGKKGLNVAYEKPTAQRAEEEPTEAATVKPEESEQAHSAAESTGATNEKRDQDSHVSPGDTDKEGGGVPAVHPEEACKPESRQLDLVPNEEQLVAIASEETTKSPEADPAQLLEVSALKGVASRQEGNAE